MMSLPELDRFYDGSGEPADAALRPDPRREALDKAEVLRTGCAGAPGS
jgi:hypothetical protein